MILKEEEICRPPLKLLLAEDSDDDVVIMRKLFSKAKLVEIVGVTKDGEETLAYLKKEGEYQDVSTPCLILLDINMPKMNGFEVLRIIKQDPELCHLPIIILSTSGRKEDITQCYAHGANSYIIKPGGVFRI